MGFRTFVAADAAPVPEPATVLLVGTGVPGSLEGTPPAGPLGEDLVSFAEYQQLRATFFPGRKWLELVAQGDGLDHGHGLAPDARPREAPLPQSVGGGLRQALHFPQRLHPRHGAVRRNHCFQYHGPQHVQ